jgi:hypothetical protein
VNYNIQSPRAFSAIAVAAYLLPVDALKPYLPKFFWAWLVLIVMAAHMSHLAPEIPLYDNVCASCGIRTLRAMLSPREAEG